MSLSYVKAAIPLLKNKIPMKKISNKLLIP